MRRTLALLLCLLSPMAWADRLFQVEVILFRQGGEPLPASQPAPDDWAAGSLSLDASSTTTKGLEAEAAKLSPANGYQVLLHQAWQQSVGPVPSKVSLTAGEQQLGHHPIEGTLSLSQNEVIQLDASFWANQFDTDGFLQASEQLKQSSRIKEGTLTYLDHRSLGLLVKLSPL